MPRRRRKPPWLDRCCYHVSNTCYAPIQIFRFANMRDQAMRRLREMKQKHPVRVLDFLLYPTGFRMLLAAKHPGQISDAMRFFSGMTARDWQQRKKKEGAVWRRGYNVTLVEKGPQAIRCALDMDFAMARSGDPDFFHPLLWKHSGHHDLTGVRKRYRGVDLKAVDEHLTDMPREQFRDWYIEACNRKFDFGEYAAEPWWEQALVAGSRELCEKIADTLPSSWFSLCVYPPPQTVPDMKDAFSYTVITSNKRKREYILSLAQ